MTKADLLSVGKGALIAGAGALLTYLATWVASPSGSADLGLYGPIVAAALAIAVNALRKLATPISPEPTKAA